MAHSNVHQAESEVILAAKAGSSAARTELFEQYRSIAYRVALRVVGKHEDALDVVQESFLKAFERLSGFSGDAPFRSWFLRIVGNQALDSLRARKLRLTVSLSADDSDATPQVANSASIEGFGRPRIADEPAGDREDLTELERQLMAALQQLSPEQSAVFALVALNELTYGEVAEILEIPIGTVMSRLFHARKKLQAMLDRFRPVSVAARDVKEKPRSQPHAPTT